MALRLGEARSSASLRAVSAGTEASSSAQAVRSLKVDHGTAECREGNLALITAPDGTTYALNDRAEDAGYPDIDPLRVTGDSGDKVSLGSLLSRTMKLCPASG
ncbi:hypothetical protein [Streptomyces sp. ISL-100]|uniref:hypothetical protein n=1 Tax=Streptomyces sp. ISL-100 TaxID=2819173 RepID=UPI001BEAAEC1|nr:hypothetical protein [Streptomyces sp. ISL-100]MBT2398831.1 hypothetical protein [Streptomyces sp. ISL-100]